MTEPAYAPATLSRLTSKQYNNSLTDLLGPGLDIPEIDQQPAVGQFSTVGATQVSSSNLAVEQYDTSATAIAAQAFRDEARRGALVGCAPSGAMDSKCAGAFLARFGRLAFRRPLSDPELARILGVFSAVASVANDFWRGAEQATVALLESPKFLYRTEYGQRSATDGPRRLDAYELAARLSFFLWSTTPDSALLDAAGRGDLETATGVRAQVQRLVASPRFRTGMRDFFAEALSMGTFGLPGSNDKGLGPSVVAAMREETLRTTETLLLDRKAAFSELINTPVTFVNGALAGLYGLPAPTGNDFAEIRLPADGPRVGLLGKGAFLVVHGNGSKTFPVGRGKFIREELLCQIVPPPPPGVDARVPDADPNQPRTTRQRLAAHRADPACGGCHSILDPLGLPLEAFDAQGRFRTTELGLAIDTSGELDGERFADARGLAEVLSHNADVGRCAARKLYRYATGHVEAEAQDASIDELSAAGPGERIADLVVELAASDLFSHVLPPTGGGEP